MKQLFMCGILCGAMVGVGALSAGAQGGNVVLGQTKGDQELIAKLRKIEPLPKDIRTPVLMIGDSMMRLLGPEMEKALTRKVGVSSSSFSSIGSGLARTDAFDWPKKVSELMVDKKPLVVVVTLGANDHQVLGTAGGARIPVDTPEWNKEYSRRLGQIMDILIRSGAKKVIWLGLPDMKDPVHAVYAKDVNELVRVEASTRPQVTIFDTAPVLSRTPGKYKAYVMGASGDIITVRNQDGIHVSPDGAKRLAEAISLTYWPDDASK